MALKPNSHEKHTGKIKKIPAQGVISEYRDSEGGSANLFSF